MNKAFKFCVQTLSKQKKHATILVGLNLQPTILQVLYSSTLSCEVYLNETLHYGLQQSVVDKQQEFGGLFKYIFNLRG